MRNKGIGWNVKLGTMIVALASAVFAVGGLDSTTKAEEHLDGDGVYVAQVESVDQFRQYIDSDGEWSSTDTITTAWSGYGDVHKLVIDEPGELVVSQLDGIASSDFQLQFS